MVSNGDEHNMCSEIVTGISSAVNNTQENGSNDSKEKSSPKQLKESKQNVKDVCESSQAPKNSGCNVPKDDGAINGTHIDNDGEKADKTLEPNVSKKSNKGKQDQHVQKSPFSVPLLSSNKSRVESTKKPESTFIKVDYLKPAKPERTKENVSRVLDFASEEVELSSKAKEALPLVVIKKDIKTEPILEGQTEKVQDTTQISLASDVKQEVSTKSEVKKETGSSHKHSKSSSHSSTSHHKSHSSSHHKSSSSSHRSRHSNSKECSRCYRRSKIKKTNIGIQVRPDEGEIPKPPTRTLEFEASHRVGVNRRPVVIATNLSYLKYGRFYHIEVHPNGGASIVHMYQDELDTLTSQQMTELVDEFFELTFSEDENGFAYHVMGVVHDGARYLPDLLEHMAENYSNLTVKSGVLGRNNDIETCTMLQYYDQVLKTYDEGTVRYLLFYTLLASLPLLVSIFHI